MLSVRYKISLLITAAGFFCSLIFSLMVLAEMLERPFLLLDAELDSLAHEGLLLLTGDETKLKKNPLEQLDEDRYWFQVYDTASNRLIHQSGLSQLAAIPAGSSESPTTLHLNGPSTKGNLSPPEDIQARVGNYKIELNGRMYQVTVGLPLDKLDEERWEIIIKVVLALCISLVILALSSYYVAGLILRPLQDINDQIVDITENHLDRRLEIGPTQDEFSNLAATLNRIFDRLQHAFIRQKQLLADASHELKTPLSVMRLLVDDLDKEHSRHAAQNPHGRIADLSRQLLRMDRLVRDLLALSSLEKTQNVTREKVALNDLLTDLLADYSMLAADKMIDLQQDFEPILSLYGDHELLRRLFSNLLDNAVKYTPEKGRISLSAHVSTGSIIFVSTNTGYGIPHDLLDRVFEQFYRIEQSRAAHFGGVGLGLSIAKRIVDLHNGQIDITSTEDTSTTVSVLLPSE